MPPAFNTVHVGNLVAVQRPDACLLESEAQKQPFRGILRKRRSENMQQIYRRTPISKCDFKAILLKSHFGIPIPV